MKAKKNNIYYYWNFNELIRFVLICILLFSDLLIFSVYCNNNNDNKNYERNDKNFSNKSNEKSVIKLFEFSESDDCDLNLNVLDSINSILINSENEKSRKCQNN